MQRHDQAFLAPLLVAAALTAAAAAAHSTMQETIPADGAALASPPERIETRFEANMRLTLARLTDETGAETPLEPSRAPTPVTVFTARPGASASGRYKAEWRGLAADGHPMDGASSFSARRSRPTPPRRWRSCRRPQATPRA